MKNAVIVAVTLLVAGCGATGGTQQTASSSSPPAPPPPSFTPIPVAGQWMMRVSPLGIPPNPGYFSLVELNLTQTGTQIFASTQQVAVFQDQVTGTYLGHPTGPLTLCGGNDSFEGTFTSATQASFVFFDTGGNFTGQSLAFDQNNPDFLGTTVVAGGFSAPRTDCFPGVYSPSSSGGLGGVLIKPFSGTYSGMLNSQPVILTMNQGGNYSLTATGTDNAAAITLSGTVIGGAFFVSDGGGNSYMGFYDPHANNFSIYDSKFNFLGLLNAGSVP